MIFAPIEAKPAEPLDFFLANGIQGKKRLFEVVFARI